MTISIGFCCFLCFSKFLLIFIMYSSDNFWYVKMMTVPFCKFTNLHFCDFWLSIYSDFSSFCSFWSILIHPFGSYIKICQQNLSLCNVLYFKRRFRTCSEKNIEFCVTFCNFVQGRSRDFRKRAKLGAFRSSSTKHNIFVSMRSSPYKVHVYTIMSVVSS